MAENADTAARQGRFRDIVKCELALFRKTPLLAAAAILLILIPSFYTGTYVGSIWNPYGNLNRLPVALTTLDQGVTLENKTINLGADLAAKLKNEKTFTFLNVPDEQQAQAAVRSGRAYFAIVVPADFSANAVSGTQAGKLKLYVSGGRSYVGKEIAEHSVAKIAHSLDAGIAAQKWNAVLTATAKSRQAATQLRDGAQNALTGTQQIEQGLAQAGSGADQLTAGQKQLAEGLQSIDTKQLVSAGDELHTNTAKLAEGLEKLPALNVVLGVPRKDLAKLADGARQYQGKIVELADGIDKASSGAAELAQKNADLSSGIAHLHNGSTTLAQGLTRIHDGLTQFVDAIPDQKQDAQSLAVPVEYETIDLVPVSANGPAFAPYFMALSMWIGVLTVSFLFRLRVLPDRFADAGRVATVAGKWACPLLIASLAAITLGIFIHLILRVPIRHMVGYYVILLAAAFTFGAIIFALNSLLGDAGKLLALILLIVQISVVGGAYPIHVEPPIYQALSPWLPMSSVVFGLRAAMFGSFDGDWPRFVLALLPWFLMGLTAGLLTAGGFSYVGEERYGPAMDLNFARPQ